MALLFHTFSTPRQKYVFDANTNSVLSISDEQFIALNKVELGDKSDENMEILRKLQDKGYCLDVMIEDIQNYNSEIITAHLDKNIQQITLQVTQRCNLRCEYCTYSGKYTNRTHALKSMDFETAKKALNFILERSVDVEEIAVGFYGGEPLLELPLIRKCVDYIKESAPNRSIIFTITTNGTLLTLEVYEYLVDNGFNIVISLDGPQPIHDLSRKFPNGKGSYDIIMENLMIIQKHHEDVFDKIMFNAVINPEVNDNCAQEYFKPNDLLPFYKYSSNFVNETYSEHEIDYNDVFMISYKHEICKLILFMVGKIDKKLISPLIINIEGDYKSEYKRLLRIPKLPTVCHPGGPCVAGAMRLFVNTDGKFFPCERVSEKSEIMNIGNLETGFDYDKIKIIMNPAKGTAEHCKKCWMIMHCGMCSAHSDNLTGLSSELRLSQCRGIQIKYENKLKTLCFLKEAGYDFKR